MKYTTLKEHHLYNKTFQRGARFSGKYLSVFVLRDFAAKHGLEHEHLYFIEPPYLDNGVREAMEREAAALGFRKTTWVKTGGVITCHGGPGAFGIVGTAR